LFKPKVVYQLIDLNTGTVVDEANVKLSKGDLQDMIELGDYPDTDYRLVKIEDGHKRTVWKLTRNIQMQNVDTVDVAKMTEKEAMDFLLKKRDSLEAETHNFEAIVKKFGDHHGDAVLGTITTPKDGFNRGVGTALYKGLTHRSDDVVDKMFGTFDGLTALFKGAGLYLAARAGEGAAEHNTVRDKTVKTEDGDRETSFGEEEGDEKKEEGVDDGK